MTYVTRFAPSPTGPLHLGHAYSALTAWDRAQAKGGRFRLRIEDIDRQRSKPQWEAQIYDDLHWLGIAWEEPVMRQSDRLPAYRTALDVLISLDLCYPCCCSRGDIRAALSAPQEGAPAHGPDGLVYPGTCRARSMFDAGPSDVVRLNIAAAVDHLGEAPYFRETALPRPGVHRRTIQELRFEIGDVVLARRDMGTSYHLSVVVDDAEQGITEVVRGNDLFMATFIHILLQDLLALPRPAYHHHKLIRDDTGKRLAKRDDARAISRYRDDGATPQDIRALVGLT